MSKRLRHAQIGCGWISQVHKSSYDALGNIDPVVCWSHTEANANAFAKEWGFSEASTDWRSIVTRKDIDTVTVATPNSLHGEITLEALRNHKHVMVEKPLCTSQAEAEEILHLSKKNGLVVAYAEELCYLPKFERMKQIADGGGIGDVYMVKQCEKHEGPYSPWFFSRDLAGGGILMDMGCHAIEFCRWFVGKKAVKSVTAHMAKYLHGESCEVEDHVILTMEFDDGTLGQVESSWALKGGMASTAEAYGTKGVLYGDLLAGTGLKAFSEEGYLPDGYRATKGGPDSVGWSVPDWEWLWSNGYPQEFKDFFTCVREGGTPTESAQDGLAVLEIMLAGYASAGAGKTIHLPFRPEGVERPVDLWLHPENFKV